MSASTINELFAKQIDRAIEGVIKADDASQLATEVEEYVLTNEAAKGVEQVLEAYTNYTNANGVWISGFFGSGKSHLLKMLAHLLGDIESHNYSREKVSEQFQLKAEGAFLPALIERAGRIPAKSLLFNIDQKATLISKDQSDALLKVFVKIFDESRGYYGNQGHIARFERDLDGRGQYSDFKEAFERIARIPWSQGREQTALEAGNIDKAFAEVNGAESPGIIRQYLSTYAVSIEDFADEVAAWLDTQPEGFRLNFFVDEVGQYIGTNTQLMLNLQTIAESLATKCNGRSWIFVTSQEDMEKVGGDRTKEQANDFSKIQARFSNRLKLTSQDVEEVIRKRLLAKTPDTENHLKALYSAEHSNFKTLFDFVEGRHYPNYRDEQHFVGTYPFVSYQFPLFQSAIEGISDHNIFEGRNSSVGERSMLGVVQQVATSLADLPVGTIASFDQMFEGIRASLKSANQRAISDAERSESLPTLAVRLLKALFLVKYVDTFKATARNLTVLVYDHFGTDLTRLAKDVNAALNALEAQTYIQRNGDLYDYLTNEEQKIEQEIKSTDIDNSEVSGKLNKLLAESVIRKTKVKYKNNQNFPFGHKLDGTPYGKQYELTLHLTSPETEFNLEQIKAHSAGLDELRVVLPNETNRVLGDLRLLLKTEKYIKRAQGSSRTSIEQTILQAKGTQNVEREKEIIDRLRSAVGSSTLIHNATVLDIGSTDAETRITDGFQRVIASTYTNLSMLGGRTFTEQNLSSLANPNPDVLIDETLHLLDVPGGDLLGHLEMRSKNHEQVTMRQLIERYSTKPYGWDQWSIVGVVAYLTGQSKVELQLNGKVLARTEIANTLRNTHSYSSVVVAPQRVFDAKTVHAFRKFVVDFTDDGSLPKEPLELASEAKSRLEAKLAELKALRVNARFAFVEQLDNPISLLVDFVNHSPDWYITDFREAEDLLDAKDDVIDPIKAFINGNQKSIFERAQAFMRTNQASLSYLPAEITDAVEFALEDPNIFRGNKTLQLGQALRDLEQLLETAVDRERTTAKERVDSYWSQILSSETYQASSELARQRATDQVENVFSRIASESQIIAIQQQAERFIADTYPQIIDDLKVSNKTAGQVSTPSSGKDTPPENTKKTISIKKISLPSSGEVLENSADIERYLDKLRDVLLATINDNKRITL